MSSSEILQDLIGDYAVKCENMRNLYGRDRSSSILQTNKQEICFGFVRFFLLYRYAYASNTYQVFMIFYDHKREELFFYIPVDD